MLSQFFAIFLIHQPFGAYDMERHAYPKKKINHRLSTFTHIGKYVLDHVTIPA